MFIYNLEVFEESAVLEKTQALFGVVPPHWKLLAGINPRRFEMFIEEIGYLLHHPHIHPDFFAFLRLFVANREDFAYCKSFNTKLLLARGYDKQTLQRYKEEIGNLPLDAKYQVLAEGVMKALYTPKDFTREDIHTLKAEGWCDDDIYDAIDHGAFLFKFARIIKAYLS